MTSITAAWFLDAENLDLSFHCSEFLFLGWRVFHLFLFFLVVCWAFSYQLCVFYLSCSDLRGNHIRRFLFIDLFLNVSSLQSKHFEKLHLFRLTPWTSDSIVSFSIVWPYSLPERCGLRSYTIVTCFAISHLCFFLQRNGAGQYADSMQIVCRLHNAAVSEWFWFTNMQQHTPLCTFHKSNFKFAYKG